MSDYLVVGAGSAGCVLAHRLSAQPDVHVTLVEAGGMARASLFTVPAAGGQFFRSQYDWDYDTHLERGLNNRRVYLPQARVAGGGSSVNGMAYVRGHRDDYDSWGLAEWTYEALLPYFKRSEDNERGPSFYHGSGGPLRVSDSRANNPSTLAFLRAALDAGFPLNDDFNGPQQKGFGVFQVTQREGSRASTASEFLEPALSRDNLRVITDFEVHRVLIEGGRAVGVEGTRLGESLELRADAEVILASGSYQSPKILMHSGVGPADHLRSFGINVVMDHPGVGQNLHDHPEAWLSYAHDEPVSLLAASDPAHVSQYEEESRGLLTAGGPETGGFVSLTGQDEPDLQLLCMPVLITDQFLSPPLEHGLSIGPLVLKPESRGAVSLFSPNPAAKPKITMNYLTQQADLETMVAGIRLSLDLASASVLNDFTTRPVSVPRSNNVGDLKQFAKSHVVTGHHPVGTCALGSVVDEALRVHGIESLRVVDASVIPTIMRGNTMAPVIAIAEKASDLILGCSATREADVHDQKTVTQHEGR